MLRDFRLLGFMVFHISVGFFALVLMVTAFYPLHAQTHEQIAELDRRITSIETLNLDHRLTVIETTLEDLHSDRWTHAGTMIGVALLTMERVAQAIKGKIKEAE